MFVPLIIFLFFIFVKLHKLNLDFKSFYKTFFFLLQKVAYTDQRFPMNQAGRMGSVELNLTATNHSPIRENSSRPPAPPPPTYKAFLQRENRPPPPPPNFNTQLYAQIDKTQRHQIWAMQVRRENLLVFMMEFLWSTNQSLPSDGTLVLKNHSGLQILTHLTFPCS